MAYAVFLHIWFSAHSIVGASESADANALIYALIFVFVPPNCWCYCYFCFRAVACERVAPAGTTAMLVRQGSLRDSRRQETANAGERIKALRLPGVRWWWWCCCCLGSCRCYWFCLCYCRWGFWVGGFAFTYRGKLVLGLVLSPAHMLSYCCCDVYCWCCSC